VAGGGELLDVRELQHLGRGLELAHVEQLAELEARAAAGRELEQVAAADRARRGDDSLRPVGEAASGARSRTSIHAVAPLAWRQSRTSCPASAAAASYVSGWMPPRKHVNSRQIIRVPMHVLMQLLRTALPARSTGRLERPCTREKASALEGRSLE